MSVMARRLSSGRRAVTLVLAALVAALAVEALPLLQPRSADAQIPFTPDPRYAGLQWTFVRIRYHAWTVDTLRYQQQYWSEPWAIDAPAAEQNLSRRLRSVTAITVNDPIVLELDDPKLWTFPWIYFVEPGNLRLTEQEVPILREFLLRGGTAMFDDFHGPIEWGNLERELKRVFPDRAAVDLPPDHPIFGCFYTVDHYPQIPGLGSFFNGRTWEKGGYVPHLRAITDDDGRAMALINWNTDMGDGWEWSNAEDYPGYLKYTADAYRMGINEVIYALTH
ncbi:MAG: DUF4159 domain-containing protein [Acidobacteria bacterium]|nr:DUF4159 domain-containing protein [Acidobacteriota bacterium]